MTGKFKNYIFTDNEGDSSVIRIIDGPNNTTGRVEIYHDDEWGTVCDDDTRNIEASVLCRSLGYDSGERVVFKWGDTPPELQGTIKKIIYSLYISYIFYSFLYCSKYFIFIFYTCFKHFF